MTTRREHDLLGDRDVPADAYYGVHTLRAVEDKVFPLAHAQRYAAALPNARIEEIADSFSLTQEDQPERLSELITAFIAEPRKAA